MLACWLFIFVLYNLIFLDFNFSITNIKRNNYELKAVNYIFDVFTKVYFYNLL